MRVRISFSSRKISSLLGFAGAPLSAAVDPLGAFRPSWANRTADENNRKRQQPAGVKNLFGRENDFESLVDITFRSFVESGFVGLARAAPRSSNRRLHCGRGKPRGREWRPRNGALPAD